MDFACHAEPVEKKLIPGMTAIFTTPGEKTVPFGGDQQVEKIFNHWSLKIYLPFFT